MAVIIEIVSLAHQPLALYDGVYLETFDPDGNNGRGLFSMTNDIDKAKKFDTITDAMSFWRLQSTTHPYRLDGRPNLPLTSFNVVFKAA